MRWEVSEMYDAVIDLRDPGPEDRMTFQVWGADDPDNCVVVVAQEEYEMFARVSRRGVLDLLDDLSSNSFALPDNWVVVSI